jgi:hypothetical protein
MKWRFRKVRKEPDLEQLAWRNAVRQDVARTLHEIHAALRFLLPWHWWRVGRQWWEERREFRQFEQQEGLGPPSLAGAARSVFAPRSFPERWQNLRAELATPDAAGAARSILQALVVILLIGGILWALFTAGGREDPRLRNAGRRAAQPPQ